MENAILQSLNESNCQYALYIKHSSSPAINIHNHDRFLSASIIKVPILLAWLFLERQGVVDRAELCNLDSEPQVQGAGYSWLLRGRRIPYQDVLMMMIALSDNLCTNLIIARAGIQRLAETIRGPLGLHGTELNRKLMDAEARQRGLENWTTPQDCIHLYDLIANLPDQDRALVELMLLANQDDALLKRNLPRDTVDFYHKTGSLTGVLHDWGYTRNCQLFLLTNNVQAEPAMFSIFGQAGTWLLE